jgi:DNA repair photolyase
LADITISTHRPSRLLNPAGGYLRGYTHTLNPYGGCAFGCAYCYVRRLPVALFEQKEWGRWVKVKENAPELLARELKRARKKGPVTIFMSSSTDPYQPLEARLMLTRRLLEVMIGDPPHFLFLQTRSPLVERDIDLLSQLKDRLCVSITIETDREEVRKAFTPAAPPLAARRRVLNALRQAGIPAQAAVSPLLPFTERFPAQLKQVTDWVCLDDFFLGDGAGGRRTERLGIGQQLAQLGYGEWYHPDKLKKMTRLFQSVFGQDHVLISQQGFAPFLRKEHPPQHIFKDPDKGI